MIECPNCSQELEWLDVVWSRISGKPANHLYVCRNPDCDDPGCVYTQDWATGQLIPGSYGLYPNRLEVE